MRKAITAIIDNQKNIMDQFDKKYTVDTGVVWNATRIGGNERKDIGQAGEGKYFRG